MSAKDYYEILGIRPNASDDEIGLAYKGRRTQYHPDKYPNADDATLKWATAKMQEVNEAYQVLSDKNRRREYDENAHQDTKRSHQSSTNGADAQREPKPKRGGFSADGLQEDLHAAESEAKEFIARFEASGSLAHEPARQWRNMQVDAAPISNEIARNMTRTRVILTLSSLAVLAIAVALIAYFELTAVWILFGAANLVLLIQRRSKAERDELGLRAKMRDVAETQYRQLAEQWEESASGKPAIAYRHETRNNVQSYLSRISRFHKDLDHQREASSADQMQRYLESLLIASSEIPNVGPSRTATLNAHGVYSAADITRNNFYSRGESRIPNVGEAVYGSLVAWRAHCEAHFKFDSFESRLLQEIRPLDQKLAEERSAFRQLGELAPKTLERKISTVREQRKSLLEPLADVARRRAQAEADFNAIDLKSYRVAILLAACLIAISGATFNQMKLYRDAHPTVEPVSQPVATTTTSAVTVVPASAPTPASAPATLPEPEKPVVDQPPASPDFSDLAGKLPLDAMDNPLIKDKVEALLGNSLASFKERLQVASPMTRAGEWIVGNGGMAHLFRMEEAAIAINTTNGRIVATMLTNGEQIKGFGVSAVSELPPPLQEWYRRHGGAANEAREAAAAALSRQNSAEPTSITSNVANAQPRNWAPSFDCAKVGSNVGHMICDNKELSDADLELAQAYNQAWTTTADKQGLQAEQFAWSQNERDTCADVQCLKNAYRERIDQLRLLPR